MEPIVAVTNATRLKQSIKNELLIFDRIALSDYKFLDSRLIGDPDYRDNPNDPGAVEEYIEVFSEDQRTQRNELEWLISKELIVPTLTPEELGTGDEELDQLMNELYSNIPEKDLEWIRDSSHRDKSQQINSPIYYNDPNLALVLGLDYDYVCSLISRISAASMRNLQQVDAYPLMSNAIPLEPIKDESKAAVLKIVLNKLPVISDETPWESIFEFKSDEAARRSYLALRNWISEIAKQSLTRSEIEEKIEFLQSEYQMHLNLHEMKYSVGTIETVAVTIAELAEDLVHLKWSKIAKSLFDVGKGNIRLLENELSAPGHQMAYILKTNKKFGN